MNSTEEKDGLKQIIIDKLLQEDEITLLELYKNLLEKRKDKEKFCEIPASIFNSELSPLECVVAYLRNILSMEFSEIAKRLNRNKGSIWLTYQNATSKNIDLKADNSICIPTIVLADRHYSLLENLVSYLKEKKMISVKEIGKLIGKSEKTIYTVYSRMRAKRK